MGRNTVKTYAVLEKYYHLDSEYEIGLNACF